MQNAVTCCESPRLSPLVRDKGVARWRTPFWAGISFCSAPRAKKTIITTITVIIIGRSRSQTVASVYILHFATFRFNKWRETFDVDSRDFDPEALGSHLVWFKKKKKKRFSQGSNLVRMCVGRISLSPTHVVKTSWWFSICWQLSSLLRVCFETISWPVARTG